MDLTVFRLLVVYGVDSGAVMVTSVFMTIRILWPKRSGGHIKWSLLCNPYSWQNKNFPKQIFDWLIAAKIIAGDNVIRFSNLGRVTYKI